MFDALPQKSKFVPLQYFFCYFLIFVALYRILFVLYFIITILIILLMMFSNTQLREMINLLLLFLLSNKLKHSKLILFLHLQGFIVLCGEGRAVLIPTHTFRPDCTGPTHTQIWSYDIIVSVSQIHELRVSWMLLLLDLHTQSRALSVNLLLQICPFSHRILFTEKTNRPDPLSHIHQDHWHEKKNTVLNFIPILCVDVIFWCAIFYPILASNFQFVYFIFIINSNCNFNCKPYYYSSNNVIGCLFVNFFSLLH